MTDAVRYVHRNKVTGNYAVARDGGAWVSYEPSLQRAKIYTAKRGGKIENGFTKDDYEWVEVSLTLNPAKV